MYPRKDKLLFFPPSAVQGKVMGAILLSRFSPAGRESCAQYACRLLGSDFISASSFPHVKWKTMLNWS